MKIMSSSKRKLELKLFEQFLLDLQKKYVTLYLKFCLLQFIYNKYSYIKVIANCYHKYKLTIL